MYRCAAITTCQFYNNSLNSASSPMPASNLSVLLSQPKPKIALISFPIVSVLLEFHVNRNTQCVRCSLPSLCILFIKFVHIVIYSFPFNHQIMKDHYCMNMPYLIDSLCSCWELQCCYSKSEYHRV